MSANTACTIELQMWKAVKIIPSLRSSDYGGQSMRRISDSMSVYPPMGNPFQVITHVIIKHLITLITETDNWRTQYLWTEPDIAGGHYATFGNGTTCSYQSAWLVRFVKYVGTRDLPGKWPGFLCLYHLVCPSIVVPRGIGLRQNPVIYICKYPLFPPRCYLSGLIHRIRSYLLTTTKAKTRI